MKNSRIIFGIFFLVLFQFQLQAQVTKIYDFTGIPDGSVPIGDLLPIGNTLYGFSAGGGSSQDGIIYKINSDGSGFTKLHSFSGNPDGSLSGNGNPKLIFDGQFLWGMTNDGGTTAGSGAGTIFRIKPDGTEYSATSFGVGPNIGDSPEGYLTLKGQTLYGMTVGGGNNDLGTIFKFNTDGTSFSILHHFQGFPNSGSKPRGSLIVIGDTLFGMTSEGGVQDKGTIFRIQTNGSNFSTILDFTGAANGKTPNHSLVYDGSYLYGNCWFGGNNDAGTIFRVKTNGTQFQKLLDGTTGAVGYFDEPLMLDGNNLYTFSSGNSKLFKLPIEGAQFTELFQFTGSTSQTLGLAPRGQLCKVGDSFYGVCGTGGLNSEGTIFKYTPQQNVIAAFGFSPQLPIINNPVQFSDLSTGQPNQWQWDFGDGSPTSNIQNPVHSFSSAGTYTVSLSATNSIGTNTTTQSVVISPAPVVCDTINYPLNGSLTAYPALNNGNYAGYITGNNFWADKAKANFFSAIPPNTAIKGLYLNIPYKFGNSSCTAAIWSNTGTNGAPSQIPISTKVINLSNITTGFTNLTYVEFTNPVTVSGPFYAGLILPTGTTDTIVIASNTDGSTNPGTAWEQWSNGTWTPISSASSFGINISLAVFPRICPTGVTEINDTYSNAELQVYPNPTSGLMRISVDGSKGKVQFDVTSISGKLIKRFSFEQHEISGNLVELNLSELVGGIYFLHVNQRNRLSSKKIIIQN